MFNPVTTFKLRLVFEKMPKERKYRKRKEESDSSESK